jgi:hypothetical protein
MTAAVVLVLCGALSVTIAQQIHHPMVFADFVFVSGVLAIWLGVLALGFGVIQ